jgi:predicted extracellular nuclease
MRKLVPALLFTATTGLVQAQDCSELFISEYVTGSGNNRALELYNPTNAAIDLSQYSVGRFRDGSGTPMLVALAGTIAAKGTYVVVVDKRDPNGTGLETPVDAALQAVADTFVNPVYVQANSPFYFNGDDAVPLIKGTSTLLDIVGKIGEDPGTAWSDANGTWWTVDHTLIRKPGIMKGDANGLDDFLPEVEWDSLPNNTFTNLGWHDCACLTFGVNDVRDVRINLFPNPAADKVLMLSASRDIEKVDVVNALGQVAYSVRFSTAAVREQRLDLSHLNTGIYIVRISLGGGAAVTRKVMLGK